MQPQIPVLGLTEEEPSVAVCSLSTLRFNMCIPRCFFLPVVVVKRGYLSYYSLRVKHKPVWVIRFDLPYQHGISASITAAHCMFFLFFLHHC